MKKTIHQILHETFSTLSVEGFKPNVIFDTQGMENLYSDDAIRWFVYCPILEETQNPDLLNISRYRITIVFAYINNNDNEMNDSAQYYTGKVDKLRKQRNKFIFRLERVFDDLQRRTITVLDDAINSIIVHQDVKFDVPATVLQFTINIEHTNFEEVCP